jgi:4-diphosphocytidyl-2-C-methyl-D-erythritol kinase
VTEFAPAKLTWTLEVTGVREDGFHELDAEMVTLSLADELEISEGDGLEIVGAPDLAATRENLVMRALDVVDRRARVVLTKKIPRGGGLGGGSADAAAILRWAGGVDDLEAARLGGDVPFCQHGGRARVRGIGELIEPLEFLARRVTLFIPDFGVATPAVYRAYDELVARGERPGGRNHLEAPARLVEPRVGQSLDFLRREYGEVVLAGSGSTMFAEGWLGEATQDVQGPAGLVKVLHVETTP